MAAGLGFKTFTTGEVLSAADVNGYLMQGVLVFATTAARDAAITSPQEGQFAFTKDTDQLWYRSASAWVASGATGDIEGVTAGTGISGGGTSGTVTVTNSMATAIDAKGDLVAGTGADTFARLGVGANATVLTADSAEATGLKWATPSGASYVGVSAYKSVAQSVSNLTVTAITFDTEDFDTDTFHNNSTNTSRFTVPSGKAGKYLLTGNVAYLAGNATGIRAALIYKNGSSYNSNAQQPAVTPSPYGSFPKIAFVLSLAVADYIEIFAFQGDGGSLDVANGQSNTNVQMTYLGA